MENHKAAKQFISAREKSKVRWRARGNELIISLTTPELSEKLRSETTDRYFPTLSIPENCEDGSDMRELTFREPKLRTDANTPSSDVANGATEYQVIGMKPSGISARDRGKWRRGRENPSDHVEHELPMGFFAFRYAGNLSGKVFMALYACPGTRSGRRERDVRAGLFGSRTRARGNRIAGISCVSVVGSRSVSIRDPAGPFAEKPISGNRLVLTFFFKKESWA